jgi:hypothetical protein
MASVEDSMRRALMGGMLAAAVLVSFAGLWALLPEARADPKAAFAALRAAAASHDLVIRSVEPVPLRPLPLAVAAHPRRLLRRIGAGRQRLLRDPGEDASRYGLAAIGAEVIITCEMQRREGAVVWVRLEGPDAESARIQSIRGALRMAMPWVPVSSPWQ